MSQIIKEGNKTIVKTGERIDTLNTAQFENDLLPTLVPGVFLEIDCAELTYISSSGLRVIQATMRSITRELDGTIKLTNVRNDIYKVLHMTGFTRHLTIEQV